MDMGNKIAPQEQHESSGNKLALIAAIVIGVLAFGGISANMLRQDTPPPPPQVPTATPFPEDEEIAVGESVIVYGLWSGDNSLIKAYDVGKEKTYLLATLPTNVKRVTAKMPDSIFYINNTNANDHGRELVKYNFAGKQTVVSVKADEGYGIDDYLLSRNGNYVVTWEVKLAPETDYLYGGSSRVNVTNLANPTAKQLLYNEDANKLVHYPRAVTDNGTVLTDMFLPNSGPGWAYGMGISDFTGQQKQDVTSMANGTYGRQPRSSYDGTKLVFVGYDGSRGAGTELIGGLARQALIYPNTVEILSSDTLQRTKLNVSSQALYDDARFDRTGNYLFVTQIPDENSPREVKLLIYNLETNSAKEIPNSTNKRGIAVFPDNKVLVSSMNTSRQAMGNLGETYQFVNSSYEVIDMNSGEVKTLALNDINTGYIGTFPIQSFAESVQNETSQEYKTEEGIQLRTFGLKPKLYEDRTRLQSQSISQADSDLTIPSIPPNASLEELTDLLEQIKKLLESIGIDESGSQN